MLSQRGRAAAALRCPATARKGPSLLKVPIEKGDTVGYDLQVRHEYRHGTCERPRQSLRNQVVSALARQHEQARRCAK